MSGPRGGWSAWQWRVVLGVWVACTCGGFAQALSPLPVMVQSGAGRFEVAAVDSLVAHAISAQAADAWTMLTGPLGLPEAFVSPIFFRVVEAGPEVGARPFQVVVEAGGVVSVRLRADVAAQSELVQRAIVQGLLRRLAVARHGVNEQLRLPRWLEEACVIWWQTRASAARLDAMKQAATRQSPVALAALLRREGGREGDADFSAAAFWWFTHLQAESGRAREWPALLGRLLAGESAEAALAASYPDRFRTLAERELWWQTGSQNLVRTRALPAFDAADSRTQLAGLTRFVFAHATEDTDVVLTLSTVLSRAGEPIVAAELARRSTALSRVLTVLHPFYRNAGLSLAEAFGARTNSAKWPQAVAVFEQDWRDALELEAVTRSALDALEAGAPARP